EEDFYIANSARKESLKEKLLHLLLEEKVDALLGSDFESTMMAFRLAYENNIKIPEDLKLVGFLNENLASYLAPSVSYVNQFPEKIGKTAMEFLVKRLYDSSIPEQKKIFETELVHLESTGF
ncbi:MAG: substrate-binding domain-containing protein, partial [Salegentibacter sp.]